MNVKHDQYGSRLRGPRCACPPRYLTGALYPFLSMELRATKLQHKRPLCTQSYESVLKTEKTQIWGFSFALGFLRVSVIIRVVDVFFVTGNRRVSIFSSYPIYFYIYLLLAWHTGTQTTI
jgi:hypothetical protein